MKKVFGILFISLLFVACQQKINKEDITKIKGYWEIEKVTFDKEKDKDYTINESFDYFQIKDNKGIRKKVMPQFDGKFLVNDAFENVVVRFVDDKAFLDYSTQYMKWSEEIISLTAENLILKNKDKIEYHYKKTEAINLLDDGKTTK